MGNRAVLVHQKVWAKKGGLGIYMHWNGGMDSVKPLLEYARLHDYMASRPEQLYMCAYALIGSSAFIEEFKHLDIDNGDNGVYVYDDDFFITSRVYASYSEQNRYDPKEVIEYINENMPKNEIINPEFLKGEFVDAFDLEIGDEVLMIDGFYPGCTVRGVITGFGKMGELWNGASVYGMPKAHFTVGSPEITERFREFDKFLGWYERDYTWDVDQGMRVPLPAEEKYVKFVRTKKAAKNG